MTIAEAEMSEEGALSPVHCEKTARAAGRGEHQHVVSVSTWSLLSQTSHRCRGHRRQELHRRSYKDIQWLLHFLSTRDSFQSVLVQLGVQQAGTPARMSVW